MSNTYKKKSIINILNDPFSVNKGTVSVSDNMLKISANSRCTFNYNYDTESTEETSKLKIEYSLVSSNTELSTRYSNNIEIILKIKFYEKEYENGEYIFKDGKSQSINIFPYTEDEYKGSYKYEEIDLNGNYIKSLDVIINFINSEDSDIEINIKKLNIFMESIVDAEMIHDEVDSYLSSGDVWLIVPLFDKLPDIGTVTDGLCCRVPYVIEEV